MPALDASSLNLKAIKALYSADLTAKSVLDEFASRQRNQRRTKLDQLLLRLGNAGKAAPRAGVINVLRKLDEYGCGNFVAGRKGHPTRFEWQYDLVSVGKAAAGGTQNVEEIHPVQNDDEEDGDGEVTPRPDGAIEHKYQLRPDWQVEISLPADLTTREAARLSEFIKTLPFDAPEA